MSQEGWRVRADCGVCMGFVNGAECKRREEDLDPRLTAEQLCVLGLVDTIERNQEKNRTTNMRYAWACLDSALASGYSYPAFANENLDNTFKTVDSILKHPEAASNVTEIIDAVALKNFEAMFRARVAMRPITPELMVETRNNIGAMIATIDEVEDSPPEYDAAISGTLAEQIVMWLQLYSDDVQKIVYPSSPREDETNIRYNHDCYQLRYTEKIAIQVKRRHRRAHRAKGQYDRNHVVVVVLQDLLDQTKSACKGVKFKRDNFLIDYIKFDLSGRESPSKSRVLDTASAKLDKTIESAIGNMTVKPAH